MDTTLITITSIIGGLFTFTIPIFAHIIKKLFMIIKEQKQELKRIEKDFIKRTDKLNAKLEKKDTTISNFTNWLKKIYQLLLKHDKETTIKKAEKNEKNKLN